MVLLDGGNLPSPYQHVDGSALIGELLAFSERQIVSPGQDDALRDVELAEGLLDLQIVGVQRARISVTFPAGLARILRVGIGDVLGPTVVGQARSAQLLVRLVT